jgi:hypothetical protein
LKRVVWRESAQVGGDVASEPWVGEGGGEAEAALGVAFEQAMQEVDTYSVSA